MSRFLWKRAGVTLILLAGLACALAACGKTPMGVGASSASPTSAATLTPLADESPTPSPTLTAYSPPCAASQLALTASPEGAASGHIATLYQLTNISSTACSLQGFPNARLLDSKGRLLPIKIERVTLAYVWNTTPLNTIEAPPGSPVFFRVQTQNAPQQPGQSCVTPFKTIIYPPRSKSGFTSPIKLTTCDGIVYISPVVASVNDL